MGMFCCMYINEFNVAPSTDEERDIVKPEEDFCSGQLIPDTVLSFSSVFAGANPSLN